MYTPSYRGKVHFFCVCTCAILIRTHFELSSRVGTTCISLVVGLPGALGPLLDAKKVKNRGPQSKARRVFGS